MSRSYADMWNMGNADAAEMKRLIGVIERHGDTVGRNTDEIEKTLMLANCYKAPKQREEMLSSIVGMMAQTTPERARDSMIIGSKQECVDKIEGLIKAGVTHFIFHAQPSDDRRGGHPGFRRGHYSAVPLAVKNRRRRTYHVATLDVVATQPIPAFAAAITVPNIITAERIAAKTNPAVFMCMPLTRNTHDRNRRLREMKALSSW